MLAPMAMMVSARAGVPLFLMAIMVGNGASAGSLSPFAPTGIIVNGIMERIGLAGYEWRTYAACLTGHAIVAFGGYFLFGGWRLFTRTYAGSEAEATASSAFDAKNLVTLGVIALGSVVMATVSAIFVIGVMMIMAGVTEIITAFSVKEWGRFALWVLLGLLYVAAGVICFFRPFEAAALSPAMGLGAMMLAGVVVDSIGIRLVGWGGVLALAIAAVPGWILAVRRRPDQATVAAVPLVEATAAAADVDEAVGAGDTEAGETPADDDLEG